MIFAKHGARFFNKKKISGKTETQHETITHYTLLTNRAPRSLVDWLYNMNDIGIVPLNVTGVNASLVSNIIQHRGNSYIHHIQLRKLQPPVVV